jgi:hypothetical protein
MAERKNDTQSRQEPAKKTAKDGTPDPVPEGVYVALEPLMVGVALAFARGDRVPAEHVNKFGWQDKVRAYDDDNESEG